MLNAENKSDDAEYDDDGGCSYPMMHGMAITFLSSMILMPMLIKMLNMIKMLIMLMMFTSMAITFLSIILTLFSNSMFVHSGRHLVHFTIILFIIITFIINIKIITIIIIDTSYYIVFVCFGVQCHL